MNTPTPAPVGTTTLKTIPGLGAFLGTSGGLLLASKLHLDPTDPWTGGALISTLGTVSTVLFHWLGQKLGIGVP